jgi:peptide/nickel transport system substrate-binding protein
VKRLCAASLLVLFGACRSSGPGASSQLRFAIDGDPKSFDPNNVTESNSQTIRDLTAGTLLRINRVNGELQPQLAESWELQDGGRAIAFHLREGLKFSDGSPLTSADVVRSFNRVVDPKKPIATGDAFHSDEATPEAVASSPRDLVVRYKSPKPRLDSLFDTLAIEPAVSAKLPATAGPFFAAEYHPGEYIRLARNPNYWNKPLPKLDSIRIDFQSNHEIELTRFLRGEFQLIDRLKPDQFRRIAKEKPGAALDLGPSLDSEFLWFNQSPAKSLPDYKRAWFTSAPFRHAISAAIHREDIVQVVYDGHAYAAAGPTSTANRLWFNSALKPLPTDPEAALKALAAEGFVLTAGVLRDKAGHPVEFSLLTNAGNAAREKMAALIQSDLSKLGIRVNTVTLDMKSVVGRIGGSLDYEAVLLGSANVEIDPIEEVDFWRSSSPMHPWWPNQKTPATPWEKRIDELEALQASNPSREVRKNAVDELQQIVRAEEPVVYLVNPDYLVAISPALKGLQLSVSPPQIWWNIESISF